MSKSPIRPTDDAAVLAARRLVRLARSGALASVDAGGHPLATLTLAATDSDGTPVLLVSRLSGHTKNLEHDPRSSLLISAGGKGDPLAHPRLSLITRARFTARASEEGARVRRRFLAKHPKAALYADFGDFSFVALTILSASLNGGFGKAYELTRQEMRCATEDAGELVAAEESALAHLNADHREALSRYAQVFGGAPAGAWRATGLDPDGLDLGLGDKAARIDFGGRVTSPARLQAVLKDMAARARAAQSGP